MLLTQPRVGLQLHPTPKDTQILRSFMWFRRCDARARAAWEEGVRALSTPRPLTVTGFGEEDQHAFLCSASFSGWRIKSFPVRMGPNVKKVLKTRHGPSALPRNSLL